MVFSSLVFLFTYLPVVLLVYYISPPKWRNWVLFIVNMLFYGWGEPVYLFLMLISIFIDYLLGMGIEKYREKRYIARNLLIMSIIWNIGLLFFFKYFDYTLQLIQKVGLAKGISPLGLALPIGISFYTFQALSYTIDVYRNDIYAEKNFFRYALFVSFFPQLVSYYSFQ